ncbi:MAG TPA: RNA methyltransferase [Prolixibacteraceae bacterium]|nr:RNA methyltransferase [Prolixibacteraceae bacterium]HPV18452.1 RNA methyltransferase [Prolixibacteraceae bacterium]
MTELPRHFAERMKISLGDGYRDFEISLGAVPPVSVRLNPEKWNGAVPAERVPWCSSGYYLSERPLFTADPWFHGGAYYVQEPASMFLEHAFRSLKLPSRALVLDLCGAPGGKTTHLLSLLRPGDLLVSNEVIRNRAAILVENCVKWGFPNMVVTNNDPADFGKVKELFDLIITDAPCSGEGLFRKDAASLREWSPENAALCAARQKRILAEAWKCLKPGGTLIYSTCTWNPEENEKNMEWLVTESEAVSVELKPEPAWNIHTLRYRNITGYQFLPHKAPGEGFFLAVVRKPGMPGPTSFPGLPLKQLLPVRKSAAASFAHWIQPGLPWTFLARGNEIFLFQEPWLPALSLFEKQLRILQPGTTVATAVNDQFNPHPALAHSLFLKRDAFPCVMPGLADAIRFLHREGIPAGQAGKGWVLVTYRDVPLGWLKNLEHRTNNYFPPDRRIRMAIKDVPIPWHERF